MASFKSLGLILPFCSALDRIGLDHCTFTWNKPTRKPEDRNDGATRLLFHMIESDAYNNIKFTNSTNYSELAC